MSEENNDSGRVPYWLCCGSRDPQHGDAKAKRCMEAKLGHPEHCVFGTRDSHADRSGEQKMDAERAAFEAAFEGEFFSSCFERDDDGSYAGRGLQGAWMGWQKARAGLPVGVPTPGFVWVRLLEELAGDNGCPFTASTDDYREAKPALEQLIAAGFFRDDTDSLDGDIWTAASGEQSEAADRFERAADSYAALSAVLNRVFERDDQAYDRNAERMTAEAMGTGACINMAATSIDELFDEQAPALPVAGSEEPFIFATVLDGRVQRTGSESHCREWADAWNADSNPKAEVIALYRGAQQAGAVSVPEVRQEVAAIRYPCKMWDGDDTESPEFAKGYNTALKHVEKLNTTPKPAPDVSALVEALERLVDSVQTYRIRSASPICEAPIMQASEALATYRKQAGQ